MFTVRSLLYSPKFLIELETQLVLGIPLQMEKNIPIIFRLKCTMQMVYRRFVI